MIGRGPGLSAALFAGIAALLPLAATISGAQAATSAPDLQFSPPQKNLTLTRTLRRALSGGKEVLTKRIYLVSISRDGDGYRVDGKQIDCMVEAPPMLQSLAAIEKARVDNGMFPILLDARGAITRFGTENDIAAQAQAAGLATGLINQSRLAEGDRAQAQSFIGQLQRRPATHSDWPLDLFNAEPGKRSETRRIALPDGSEGIVTISEEARQTGQNRHEDTLERVVITDMGSSRRVTREEWTLVMIDR